MKRDASEMKPGSCGWDEEALLDYVDDALHGDRGRSFESHLGGCDRCRRDVAAYRDLGRALTGMSSLEAPPGFDEAILAAVLPEPARAGVAATPAAAPRHRFATRPTAWLAAAFLGLPRPVRLALASAAFLGLAVTTVLSVHAVSAGGWRALAGQAVARVVCGSVSLATDGAARLMTAVKISDVLLNVARTLEPLLRSVSVAANAFGAEFWLFSTLLSLLALLGAVRLATGSAVERGIGRVHFVL